MYKGRDNRGRGRYNSLDIGFFEVLCIANHQEAHCERKTLVEDVERTGNVPMSPNKPMMLPKTSMTSILTKSVGSAASASAAVAPVIPTQTPHMRLQAPTVKPPQKSANPRGGHISWGPPSVVSCNCTGKVVFAGIQEVFGYGDQSRGEYDPNNLWKDEARSLKHKEEAYDSVDRDGFTENDAVHH